MRSLHAEGRLVDEYHTVAGLLAEIVVGENATTDLALAGRVLSRPDPRKILTGQAGVDTLTLAVTGHSTIGNLFAPLTAEFARHGMLLQPRTSDFDSYLRDLRETDSLLYAPDVESLAGGSDDLVLSVRSADRFGDNGAVGAVSARWKPDGLHIENMLLSCRVFARGIETGDDCDSPRACPHPRHAGRVRELPADRQENARVSLTSDVWG